jgi:predicted metal-dependent HD superfamily phosphohydrolase
VSAGEAWVAAARQLGGALEAATDAAADLERRYAEPHRRYHTTTHVAAVVRDAAWLAGELGLDDDTQAVVALAACAHDVVYDARPGVDEQASADWARRQLRACGIAEEQIERVTGLVLATISHSSATDDPGAAALLDADLAILGAEPEVYARYVTAVREEYAAVPEDMWRSGRAAVLNALAARDPLYLTQPARRRWETQARTNVATELESLD